MRYRVLRARSQRKTRDQLVEGAMANAGYTHAPGNAVVARIVHAGHTHVEECKKKTDVTRDGF